MRNFWKDKRVLITGHTGFKGSWLSIWLKGIGAEVIGYSLPPPTKPSLFEIGGIADGMVSVIGDIRDLRKLQATIDEHQPEIVFHMAAQALVRYSYRNPLETYSTNIMGTVNTLEAIRTSRCVRAAVIVTSDKCYENQEWIWGYRENDSLGGHDPYSSSKGCSEIIVQAYRKSFFSGTNDRNRIIPVASVRAGNVIGGGDWAEDRLVPDIMKAFLIKRNPLIRNPSAVRPWQHILEPLNGYMMLTECLWERGLSFAEAWNFGPNLGDEQPVGWVAEYLTRLWDGNMKCEMDQGEHQYEAKYLQLDCSKAKSRLGWRPKLSLPMALEWTVNWYRMYGDQQHVRQITEDQILRYQELS